MRLGSSILMLFLVVFCSEAMAQPPGGPPNGRRGQGGQMDPQVMIGRLMNMDANQDGVLTSDEVTDQRLQMMFKRIDSNSDGSVTQDEIRSFAQNSGRQGNRVGQSGQMGRNGRGMGAPPRPGQILPEHLQDELNLTEAQKKKIDALQKEVDAKLAKILTQDQQQQLAEMANRGPGGPGGNGAPGGGPGGFGPPNGPPPEDF